MDLYSLNPQIFPLKKLKTPKVYNEISVVGECDNTLIYTPCGDHQVSFLGIDEKDFCLINIGTATQISALGNIEDFSPDYENRPYFNNKYLLTISGLVGGYRLFEGEDSEKLLNQIENALNILPQKEALIFSGGGAELIYEKAKKRFLALGFKCKLFNENAGQKGLIKMSKVTSIEKGTMISEIPFLNLPIIFKNNELDFFIIDNEHGAFDYSVISGIVTNAKLYKIPAFIRISDNTRMNITKFSDIGASGFILPMTNSAEDILPVINYSKYSPIGKRGISTMRSHTLYNPPPLLEYMKKANESMKVFAQIETVSGVENIEKILAVNGLDGIFIGPNDLSCDLDCIGDKAPIIKCIEKIASACNKASKPWGIITTDAEYIKTSKENGVKYISYGSELNMLNNGCKTLKEKL